MTSRTHKPVETGIPHSKAADARSDVRALRVEKERRWRSENAEAIRSENEDIEKHGLPLAEHGLF